MPKSAERAGRILTVMRKLHRVEELKKTELQRQLSELRRSEEDILNALDREDAFHGLFLDNTTRFLRSLANEADRVSQAQQRQSKKILERAGKVKQAEKLHDTLSKRRQRVESDKHLADVVERYGGKRGASLP
jgi:hypothetical protein